MATTLAERTLIGVSGRIASRKSNLAGQIADAFGGTTASFGGYCRKITQGALDRDDRKPLQEIGRALAKFPESFSKRVLEDAGVNTQNVVVVEGIRHVAVWTSLRELFAPQRAHLVYLEVPEAEIRQRLRDENFSEHEIAELEDDETETDLLSQIPEVADIFLPWNAGMTIDDYGSKATNIVQAAQETTLASMSGIDSEGWQRYHALLSLSLNRRLTTKESGELAAFKAIAGQQDMEEWAKRKDKLLAAVSSHKDSIASVAAFNDALEKWLNNL